MDIFTFYIGGRHYAFDIDKVAEVTEPRRLVSIPKSLKYIKGVINFKGMLYSIIDTYSIFDLEQKHSQEHDIIILEDENYRLGFLSERVIGALTIPDFQEGIVSETSECFIKYIYNLNNIDVRLIDTKEVFKTIEIAVTCYM